jgi:hypothetical protein
MTSSPSSPGTPRDSIFYEARGGGEWLKTRDPQKALEKIGRLLRFTTFTEWKEVRLNVQVPASQALASFYAYLSTEEGKAEHGDWWKQRIDRATLESHRVERDEIFEDALRRAGPGRLEQWASTWKEGWEGSMFQFVWTTTKAVPEEWMELCELHRVETHAHRPKVQLILYADQLSWKDPDSGALLPFQGEAYCPKLDNTPSWPTHTALHVYLPECRMSLRARLPFTHDGAEFRAYRGQLEAALGYALAPSHVRALLVNDDGTGSYARKQLPTAARPPVQPRPGAQQRRAQQRAKRSRIF